MIWIILLLALCGLVLFLYFRFFKIPKLKNIVFVDGSLGTGKSFYSVSLAIRLYRRSKIFYWIGVGLTYVLWWWPKFRDMRLEKPVLCSNINLRGVPFVPLTMDIIMRKTRLPYKSVILIDEISLLADQMLFKDKRINDALSIFFKLLRHEMHGGYCVINSQSTSDLHFSLKYVLSDYLYIHSRFKFPFVTLMKVQEMAYSADKDGRQIVNANVGDLESNLKVILTFNKYYKRYDSYCFSIFTDDLPVMRELIEFQKGQSLKTADLVTFRDWEFIKEYKMKRGIE